VLATSHLSNDSCINENTPETTIFESSGTCVLNPEGETGPVSKKFPEDEPELIILLVLRPWRVHSLRPSRIAARSAHHP
jgi:hypothetical protein